MARMMSKLVTFGVSTLALAGAALISAAPAQAWDGYGWGHGRGYGYGGWRPHHHHRPVYARPVFGAPAYGGGYGDECRIIIKKRVHPWGDVVTRIRRCG